MCWDERRVEQCVARLPRGSNVIFPRGSSDSSSTEKVLAEL